MLTVLLPELVTAKSRLPSRSKSAVTTVQGFAPTPTGPAAVKLGTQRSSSASMRSVTRWRRGGGLGVRTNNCWNHRVMATSQGGGKGIGNHPETAGGSPPPLVGQRRNSQG